MAQTRATLGPLRVVGIIAFFISGMNVLLQDGRHVGFEVGDGRRVIEAIRASAPDGVRVDAV